MWSEQLRPRTLAEVIGNHQAKERVIEWLKKRLKRGGRGLLLVGPAGVGKTSLIQALANDFELHLVELNASDTRSAETIGRLVAPALGSTTLDRFTGVTAARRGILAFFDEIEGVEEKEDRGGLSEIVKLIRSRKILVACAATILDEKKMRFLIRSCELVHMKPLTAREIRILLKRIVKEKGLSVSEELIDRIAERCRGDARAAINDLQSSAALPESEIYSRDETIGLRDAVIRILRAKRPGEAYQAIAGYTGQVEELIHALAEAVANSPVGSDKRAKLLRVLSEADVLIGRVKRTQYWKMLAQVISFLSTAIPEIRVHGDIIIEAPLLPMMMVQLGEARNKVRDIAQKAARAVHASTSTVIADVAPFAAALAESFERGRLAGVSLREWKEFKEIVEGARAAAEKKVIRVALKQPFSLPRLGKDTFKELMRYGLKYKRGSFYVDERTFLKGVNDVLGRIGLAIEVVEAIEVGLAEAPKECLICGVEVLCQECEFLQSCRGRETRLCLCLQHSLSNEDYEKYVAKVRQMLLNQGVLSRA